MFANTAIWHATGLREYTIEPDGRIDIVYSEGVLTLAGPDTRPSFHVSTHPSTFTGVGFDPGVFPTLVGVSARELRDQRVPLTEVLRPASVRHALRQLDRASLVASGELRSVIGPSIAGLVEPAKPVGFDARLIELLAHTAKVGVPLARVAKRTGYSERQLHRVSVRAFGYGYATLAQIERYRSAKSMIRGGGSLAHVANSSGYADQSHMTREFARWGGRTPGVVSSESARMSDPFNR